MSAVPFPRRWCHEKWLSFAVDWEYPPARLIWSSRSDVASITESVALDTARRAISRDGRFVIANATRSTNFAPSRLTRGSVVETSAGTSFVAAAIAFCTVRARLMVSQPATAAKAAATKVEATVLAQFKGDKQLVFKFKKRKNYKKLRGHRQQLTRVKIESVG